MKIFAEGSMALGFDHHQAPAIHKNCRIDVNGETITITHRHGSSLSPASFTRGGHDDPTTSGTITFCPWCDAVD